MPSVSGNNRDYFWYMVGDPVIPPTNPDSQRIMVFETTEVRAYIYILYYIILYKIYIYF